MLADVFKIFCNKCIEICEHNPAYFLATQGLGWQACLKKAEVDLESMTDVHMLLIVEKSEADLGLLQHPRWSVL